MAFSFQFTVNSDYSTVANAVRTAAIKLKTKCKERPGGEFSFRVSGLKFFLYVSESNEICTLRFLQRNDSGKKAVLEAYDRILVALEDAGLEIPVVPGKPYIVTTLQLGGGIEQTFVGKQSFSMGGAAVGGFLFGDLGAAIGGFSGPVKGKTKSFLSNSAFFLLCYSNGMIEEKEVRKNTKLYAEVMAKLNATPVIHKDESTKTYVAEVSKTDSPHNSMSEFFKPDFSKLSVPRLILCVIVVIIWFVVFSKFFP